MADSPKRPSDQPPDSPASKPDDALPTGRPPVTTLSIPQPARAAGPDEIAGAIPMTPLHEDDAFGTFTPASIQRAQAMGGAAMLLRGDSGNAVFELQRALRVLRLLDEDLGDEEGQYGDLTVAAVSAFQKKHGLPITGSCDGKTRALIRQVASGR